MKRILFHKYELLKPIAEGGMGKVFLARDLHLNKLVAVKTSRNPDHSYERAAVLKEVEVLKQLNHAGLPRLIDFFEEGEELCLVIEYVEGITLEQYLRKFTCVEAEQAVKWAVELTEILAYLHSRRPSIIYRDLKPANIMIQPDGKLKLIDFGVAFVELYGQIKEQLCAGTPGYCAPEQWQGTTVGKGCDIFAVGAVLHEMLTGINPCRPPYERRPVREYDRSLPSGLEQVILICTRKKASERYQSMEQLKNALVNYKKAGRLKEVCFQIKKGIGCAMCLLTAGALVLPFIKGVEAEQLPFPYLNQPLLFTGLTICYHFLFLKRRNDKKLFRKQEKSIFLTEKKFTGLFLWLLFSVLSLGSLVWNGQVLPSTAAEREELLWVEMRDDRNRKMLLKEDAVYYGESSIRFEIPVESMPEEKLSVQLLAAGEEGRSYSSRVFLVGKKK